MELEKNDKYSRHLQGLIQFSTYSNNNTDETDFTPFWGLHDYLQETYPLIHKILEKKIIGKANLLFHWKGKKNTKKPILLMAHQDVVPVDDPSKWQYPPFSGTVAEGCLWGRGTVDDKNVLFSEMEAVEELIEEGFRPEHDIFLAFGDNEEVHPVISGADQIVHYLKSQGVKLRFVFDEGPGIRNGFTEGYDGYIADLGIAEKASATYEIYQERKGGHSSRPGSGTALGAIAEAIVSIEKHPFPYRLTPLVREELQKKSQYMTGKLKQWFSKPDIFFDKIQDLALKDAQLDAVLHTTMAVTQAYGSKQANVLPSRAGAIVNCRMLSGDTIKDVEKYIEKLLPQGVSIKTLWGHDISVVPQINTDSFLFVESILKSLYGEKLILTPTLLTGGTNSRYYESIADYVFRFGGMVHDDRWGKAHGIDEKIPLNVLGTGVMFFKELIKKYQQ